jgi:hypothetical protein
MKAKELGTVSGKVKPFCSVKIEVDGNLLDIDNYRIESASKRFQSVDMIEQCLVLVPKRNDL